MTILSVQSCCAHFTDEETRAHKVSGRSGDEKLHLMPLKESIFNIQLILTPGCLTPTPAPPLPCRMLQEA